jgi:hypothetical protein
MKLLEYLLAFSMCFMIPVSFLPQTVQQYVIALPILFILFCGLFLVYKKKFNKDLLILISIIIFAFMLTGFKFGISFNDLMSLVGILLIPLIIQIYIYKKKLSLYKSFYWLFSVYELILLIFVLRFDAFFDIYKNLLIRDKVSWAFPNYFAMISVVKISIGKIIYNNGIITKKQFIIFSLVSISIVGVSLSRTAMVMLLMVYFIPILLSTDKVDALKTLMMKFRALLTLVFLGIFVYFLFKMKGSIASASVERTLDQRFDKWNELVDFFKGNFILGTGFRSTSKYLTEGIGTTHNDYFDVLLKGGLLLFIYIYFYFAKRIFILYKKKMFVELSIAVSLLFGGLTQNPLKFLPLVIIFSVVIASSYEKKEEDFLIDKT